ncbi:ubiquitin-conjugating enzyme/RWD-like protein, partial [Cunninghamella echinulata]
NEEDLAEIQAWIRGPDDTPYETGYFKIRLLLKDGFPSTPPKGYFMTKIFHPNVSNTGEICVNTLKKDWKPDVGITQVLLTIKCLLIVPNAESALNEEAGKLLLEQYDDYAKRARLYTKIHAKAGKLEYDTLFEKSKHKKNNSSNNNDKSSTTTKASTTTATTVILQQNENPTLISSTINTTSTNSMATKDIPSFTSTTTTTVISGPLHNVTTENILTPPSMNNNNNSGNDLKRQQLSNHDDNRPNKKQNTTTTNDMKKKSTTAKDKKRNLRRL